jgi:hypothetical protein
MMRSFAPDAKPVMLAGGGDGEGAELPSTESKTFRFEEDRAKERRLGKVIGIRD